MPFGLGPHRCVGLYLANRIANHVLAQVFGRVTLTLAPNQRLTANPGITLRHTGPVHMRCHEK